MADSDNGSDVTQPGMGQGYDDVDDLLAGAKKQKPKGKAPAPKKVKGKAAAVSGVTPDGDVEFDEHDPMEAEIRAEEPSKAKRKKQPAKAQLSPGAPAKETAAQRSDRLRKERDRLRDEVKDLRWEREQQFLRGDDDVDDNEFGGAGGLVVQRTLAKFGKKLERMETQLMAVDARPGPESGPTNVRLNQTEVKKFLAMDHKVLQSFWCNLCVRRVVSYPGSDCEMKTGVSCTYCMAQHVGCVELGVSPCPFRWRCVLTGDSGAISRSSPSSSTACSRFAISISGLETFCTAVFVTLVS